MTFNFLVVTFLFVGVIVMLAATCLRPIAVFAIAAWVLYASGVLTLEQLSHNYVNPSLLTLIGLMLLSVVLEKVSFVSELSRRSVTSGGNVSLGGSGWGWSLVSYRHFSIIRPLSLP